jgi:hypothetical protein
MAISWAFGLQSEPEIANRRLTLIACVIAMVDIAILEYAWKSLASPLTINLHASFAPIQVAFAVLISTRSRQVPVSRYVLDCLSHCGVWWRGVWEFMRDFATEPSLFVWAVAINTDQTFCYIKHPRSTALKNAGQWVASAGH